MITISIPLTMVSIICLPGVYVLGVVLRNQIFPLSWIVQARTADVATLVDENVNGVRVVRSFAAEQREIRQLARAGPSAAVGQHRHRRHPGPVHAGHGEPAPRRAGRWCCSTAAGS